MNACLLFLIFWIPSTVLAAPAQVLIVRHGEKVDDDDRHLSKKGRERAQRLVEFFEQNPSVTEFGLPVAIYAAAPKHKDSSLRPYQTVAPLAKKLGLKVIQEYEKDEAKKMAKEILSNPEYKNKTVVISWTHNEIPNVAEKLGVEDAEEWDDARFDRVWRIKYVDDKVKSFDDIPQHLLPGDSD